MSVVEVIMVCMDLEKKCCTCGKIQPLSAFNVRRRAEDGRQSRCRDCSKKWYHQNKERHSANVRRIAAKNRLVYRERILEYLREHPCVDCGETDIRCLEFDHRGTDVKVGDVTRMINNVVAWSRVAAEIAKCDVRCSNCHRRITGLRAGWWRQAVHEQDVAEATALAHARLLKVT